MQMILCLMANVKRYIFLDTLIYFYDNILILYCLNNLKNEKLTNIFHDFFFILKIFMIQMYEKIYDTDLKHIQIHYITMKKYQKVIINFNVMITDFSSTV